MPRQNQGPHLSEKPNVNGYFEILWTDPGTGRSKHHSTGERTKKAAQIYLAQWVLDEQADQKRGAIVIVKSILADYKIEHVDEALLSKGTAEIGIRRSEEHTSELQSLMRISYAVFCLKKKTIRNKT